MAKLNARAIAADFSARATKDQARELLELREQAEKAMNKMIGIIDGVCGIDIESMMGGYDDVLEIDSYVGSQWKRGVVRRTGRKGGRRSSGRKR